MLSAESLALMLNVSSKTLARWSRAGRMPRPMRIGRLVRWDRERIDRWIDAGCPDLRLRGDGEVQR